MLKGVVLAAGAGTRLRPMTLVRPKALTPVGGRPLLDWAVQRARPYVGALAVNVHHHPQQVLAAVRRLDPDMHVSVEQPVALGTAGALGALRDWIDGAPVLVTNADAWYPTAGRPVLDDFVAGWDGQRPRLLCVRAERGGPGDFGDLRYVGTALLPWSSVRGLPPRPAGLYEASWAALHAGGGLDLVAADLEAVDCGTPADLDRARRLAEEEPRSE